MQEELQKLKIQNNQLEQKFKRVELVSEKVSLEPITDSQESKYFKIYKNKLCSIQSAGNNDWFPLFLSKIPITGSQYFEIEVVMAGNNYFMFGVTTADNRNKTAVYTREGSLLLYAAGSSGHYINGQGSNSIRYLPSTGDQLQVRVNLQSNTLEWLRVWPDWKSIGKITIPEGIRGKEFYPCVEFYSPFNGTIALI